MQKLMDPEPHTQFRRKRDDLTAVLRAVTTWSEFERR